MSTVSGADQPPVSSQTSGTPQLARRRLPSTLVTPNPKPTLRPVPTREDAAALDAADILAPFRDRFVVSDPKLVYLDGNSLGRLPKATVERLGRVATEEWGGGLVRSWESWLDRAQEVGDRLGTTFLGARPGETAIADSTTVNLFKLASAALDAQLTRRGGRKRCVIVSDRANFPTDRYVLESLAARHPAAVLDLIETDPLTGPTPSDVDAAAARNLAGGRRLALVTFSHVDYRSGAVADQAAVTERAHAHGALTLWDESHAVGAIPVDLTAAQVDLAVGCTYKYLNGGPGSPAFLWVRTRHLEGGTALRQPVWGWFGQREQFVMGQGYDPAPGITSFLSGTPPILALAGVDEGVKLSAEAGILALRAKSLSLTDLAIVLHDAWLAPLGTTLGTPRDDARRGSHLAVHHPAAWGISRALIEDYGVIPDFRAPDVVRLGMTPLYTTHTDVWEAMQRFRRVLATERYRAHTASPRRVT